MKTNLLLNTDSYKASHSFQYPPGTEYVYSYVESRGGDYPKTLSFGRQIFLKEYLSEPLTKENVDEADDFWKGHMVPFDRSVGDYVVNKLGGWLPLCIRGVPEGNVVDIRNVLSTVVNTDPKCAPLTSWLETSFLRAEWYGTTVATLSFYCKVEILKALKISSDDPLGQIPFKLHDFGARGVSSMESAGIGGAAHLVNFMGSDTVSGILYAKKYYREPMAGFSIPAAEHSTITSWGQENEEAAYRNMIRQFGKPGALVAVVSDSYDIYNAASNLWGGSLKQEVIDSGATIVVRPDSGDPLTVPIEVIGMLGEKFGYTVNSKGYKVLPDCIRVIQGDGITPQTLPTILDNLLKAGWSADNLAFGMGGGLLQMVNRDTQKFAMKCSSITINGKQRDVFKNPITDTGKVSKKGELALIRNSSTWETVPRDGWAYADELRTIWRCGDLQCESTFAEIRERAHNAALKEVGI